MTKVLGGMLRAFKLWHEKSIRLRWRPCLQALIFSGGLSMVSACAQEKDITYAGYVEANPMTIAAPQSGWLTAVRVERGEIIVISQSLFSLDSTPQNSALNSAVFRATAAQANALDLTKGGREADIAPLIESQRQAQVQLDLARSNEARYAQLEPKGFVSATQMDVLRAATRSAQAEVANIFKTIEDKRLSAREDQRRAAGATAAAMGADVAQAQWMVNDRDVKSRIEGRIEERLREPGEFVAQGSAILTVLPKGREFVRFYVPQAELPKLKLGQNVWIHCDNCAAKLEGKIRFISRLAEFTPPVIYSVRERQKLMFLIEATPADPDALRPGQPVDVGL